MPGPFPGMDPYLEHPARWPDLHHALITYAREALNERLPARYRARTGARIYVVATARGAYPDVAVLERRSTLRIREPDGAGGAAVADPPIVLTLQPLEEREPGGTSFTARVERTFHESLGALRDVGQAAVLVAVALAPWLLVLAVIGVPVALLVRRYLPRQPRPDAP